LLIIRSNNIITEKGTVDGSLIVEEGKIKGIQQGAFSVADATVIDAGDAVVMPGIIDPHVHINEPGRTEWEGFETATKAAIAGGITTLVDMPLNSSPVTTSVTALHQKMEAAGGRISCNVGFWGGLVPGNEGQVLPLIKEGVLGFKAFLTHSGIDEFPNVTEDDLRKVMPVIAGADLPLLVHCELTDDIVRAKGDPRSYANYLSSRPKEWEDRAIEMMIRLCEEFKCRVHIVHLSSANSIEPIRRAKENGLPLTVETGQHYLYFNAEDIPDGDTSFKCAPPIRERNNNEQLWQALKDGVIDFVATDHSPAPPDMKQSGTGDFMKAWGGIASVQFALPVLWTAAEKHGCTPEQVAKWLCLNPAKLIGSHTKGSLQEGYDADVTIWNPGEQFTVTKEIIHHRHKLTPYLHQKLNGRVTTTILNGNMVYTDTSIKSCHGAIILNNNG
jgi:allantoinase